METGLWWTRPAVSKDRFMLFVLAPVFTDSVLHSTVLSLDLY